MTKTTILNLLRHCRPAAVIGRVALRAVNAIYGTISRALAHVREKALKLQPSITDGYSASAISLEVLMGGIGATANHCAPRPDCSRFAVSDVVAVDAILATYRSNGLAPLAPTRPALSLRDIARIEASNRAAFATAQTLASSVGHRFENNQAPRAEASDERERIGHE